MKLKVFNQANTATTKSTGHFISIQTKNGAICFSKDLSILLDLDNNKIEFIQDEDKPKDWYLRVSQDENAFDVRIKKAGTIIQTTTLCRAIVSSLGIDFVGSYRFMVADKPTDGLYAIITKSLKEVKVNRK
ncbi:MAG: hypothetical protein ACK505_06145 [Flavobacteriales bacterium]|jgi:hypothetical protein